MYLLPPPSYIHQFDSTGVYLGSSESRILLFFCLPTSTTTLFHLTKPAYLGIIHVPLIFNFLHVHAPTHLFHSPTRKEDGKHISTEAYTHI